MGRTGAAALLALGLSGALAACGLLGSTASTIGSGTSLASQGSGLSSAAVPDLGGGDDAEEAPIGRICGNRALRGQVMPEIEGEGICGVKKPVRVVSVDGILLMPQPTVTCDTANALAGWVENAVKPVFERRGDPLRSIEIASHYMCGPADAPGHETGEALDISAFGLESGEAYVVGRDWPDPERGAALAALHGSACGAFSGTRMPVPGGATMAALHYDVTGPGQFDCR